MKIKKTAAIILAVLVGLLLAALLITWLFVSVAYAGRDNFGRPYTDGVSWSADTSHPVGARLWQAREGMPGVWVEGLFSGDDQMVQAGQTYSLSRSLFLVAGGGYQFGPGRWSAHLGAGATWKRLAFHAGYNTASIDIAFGVGLVLDKWPAFGL